MRGDSGGPYHHASSGSRGASAAASRNGSSLEARVAALVRAQEKNKQVQRCEAQARVAPPMRDSESEEAVADPGFNTQVGSRSRSREQELSDEEIVTRVLTRVTRATPQRMPTMRGSVALGRAGVQRERSESAASRSESLPMAMAANPQRVPAMRGSVTRGSSVRVMKSGLKARQGITDEPVLPRPPAKATARAPARESPPARERELEPPADDLLPAPPPSPPVAVAEESAQSMLERVLSKPATEREAEAPTGRPVAAAGSEAGGAGGATSAVSYPSSTVPSPTSAPAEDVSAEPAADDAEACSWPGASVLPDAQSAHGAEATAQAGGNRFSEMDQEEASPSQCPERLPETAAESGAPVPTDLMTLATVTIKGLCDLRITDLHDWPEFFEDMRIDLNKACARFGDVVDVSVDESATEGGAWIRFASPEQAQACSEAMNRIWFGGRCITAEVCGTQVFDTPAKPLETLDTTKMPLEALEAMVEDDI